MPPPASTAIAAKNQKANLLPEGLHTLPDDDWPNVDVTFWARKAYVYARASA
jgi:hypothetical protein